MRKLRTAIALMTLICLLTPCASAAKKAKPIATPEPRNITREVVQDLPETIQAVVDIAYAEWDSLHGKSLPRSNKYTKWWNNGQWGWCAGFVTWVMLEAGVPQDYEEYILSQPEGSIEGIFHCKGSSPSKLIHSYLHMDRTTMIPQRGFIVVYGEDSNRWTHVGIVYDVRELDDGRYRITTIEGNMSNRVKMYIYDYDPDKAFSYKNKYPDNSNVSAVPEEDWEGEIDKNFRTYEIHTKSGNKKKPWYVTCFLMPWIPEDYMGDGSGTVYGDGYPTPPPEN